MRNSDSIQNYLERLNIYRANLKQLLKQQANLGGLQYTPPSLNNDIRETRSRIGQIKSVLRDLDIEFDNDPDDDDKKPDSTPIIIEKQHIIPKKKRIINNVPGFGFIALVFVLVFFCYYAVYPVYKRLFSDYLVNRGMKFFLEEEYETSLDFLNKAVEYNYNNGEAFFFLGESYCKLKRNDLAIQPYTQAVMINPEKWIYRQRLGHLLVRYPGRWLEAIEHLRQATKYNPEDAQSYSDLGYIYMESDLEMAKKYIQQGLRYNGSIGQLQYHMGVIEMNETHYSEAIMRFSRAIYYGYGSDAWYNLAKAYASDGKVDNACSVLFSARKALIIADGRFERLEKDVNCRYLN